MFCTCVSIFSYLKKLSADWNKKSTKSNFLIDGWNRRWFYRKHIINILLLNKTTTGKSQLIFIETRFLFDFSIDFNLLCICWRLCHLLRKLVGVVNLSQQKLHTCFSYFIHLYENFLCRGKWWEANFYGKSGRGKFVESITPKFNDKLR